MLTWWISQVAFWDIASGELLHERTGIEFAFVEGITKTDTTKQHLLTVSGFAEQRLQITELLPEGESRAVACFKAPQRVTSVRCHGATICVGCEGGVVCFVRAPFLAV